MQKSKTINYPISKWKERTRANDAKQVRTIERLSSNKSVEAIKGGVWINLVASLFLGWVKVQKNASFINKILSLYKIKIPLKRATPPEQPTKAQPDPEPNSSGIVAPNIFKSINFI